MIKRRSQILLAWFLAWDLLVTALAWVSADHLRFHTGWFPIYKEMPDPLLRWRNLPLVVPLSALAFELTGQYTIHRLRRFREEFVAVVKGTFLVWLFVMGFIFYTHDPYELRGTIAIFPGLAAVGLLTVRRLSWSAISRLRSHGYNQMCAIIVGTGRVARKTAHALRGPAGWAFRISASSRTGPTLDRATWTSSVPSPTCPSWWQKYRSSTSSLLYRWADMPTPGGLRRPVAESSMSGWSPTCPTWPACR